jgi:hypothetical protein
MLEKYFQFDGDSGDAAIEKHKRLLAVQAALEISKAAVSSSTANSGFVARWIYAMWLRKSLP